MLSSFFPITVNLSHIGRPRVVDLGNNCQRTNCQFRCWAELLRIVPVSQLRISLEAATIVFVPQLYFADLLSFSLMQLSNTQGGWSVNSIHHTKQKVYHPPAVDRNTLIYIFFKGSPKVLQMRDIVATVALHAISFDLLFVADLRSSMGIMAPERLSLTPMIKAAMRACSVWVHLATSEQWSD